MEKESLFKKFWKILLILILAGIFILGTEVLGGILAGLVLNDLDYDVNSYNVFTDYYPIILFIVQLTRLIGIACIIVLRKSHFKSKPFSSYIKKHDLRLLDFFKLLVIGLAMIAVSSIIVGVLLAMADFIPSLAESYKNLEEITANLDKAYPILGFISTVIMAPILEELMLRGVFFEETRRIVSAKTAIILNGVLFGLVHMNIIQGAYATFLGIIICLVYYYTDSIYAAIALHFVNNLVSTLVAASTTISIIQLVISFICLPIAFKLLKGYRDKKINREENTYIVA
ncbi:MAG: CPBP family intramembrane glutamic endopeptidase [Finegoldia sp.]|nr:CPBP family intramembrane glutamic endopeptidase [Finegoldia sp.]